ncbi:hypothetical protein ACFVQB_19765 [Paenibacillus sp. NPDC057886]|uniref:hypothetical protein n=1 Tax=Paenibacillus sp. NPDC057886 TaxID=3346270 RepID=UPI0036CA619C
MKEDQVMLRYKDDLGAVGTIPLFRNQVQKWFNCLKNAQQVIVYIGSAYRGVNPNKIIDWSIENVSESLVSMKDTDPIDLTWASMVKCRGTRTYSH